MSFIAVNQPVSVIDLRSRAMYNSYLISKLKEVTFSFKDLWHRGPGQPGKDQDYDITIISLHQSDNMSACTRTTREPLGHKSLSINAIQI
ncbi:hypothetical protein F511_32795 [Dorcoceras hygrometricum]|uniref:Uncharacterized protein n=1 Tax=Dorcoceras hygrometricum TaxID=472368 RepID=A0A2Z7CKC7_9LAMI|nr:hypothetical protein F511_32795 [Dorcoceras hygrometricum]